jgi:hypothetical protein
MSERWFIGCADCNDLRGDGGINHGIEEMRALLTVRRALAEIGRMEMANADPSCCPLSVVVGSSLRSNDEGHQLHPRWWAKHDGHTLCVVNEYGERHSARNRRGDQ